MTQDPNDRKAKVEAVSDVQLFKDMKKWGYRLFSLIKLGHPDLPGYRRIYEVHKELFRRRIEDRSFTRLHKELAESRKELQQLRATKPEGDGVTAVEQVDRIPELHRIILDLYQTLDSNTDCHAGKCDDCKANWERVQADYSNLIRDVMSGNAYKRFLRSQSSPKAQGVEYIKKILHKFQDVAAMTHCFPPDSIDSPRVKKARYQKLLTETAEELCRSLPTPGVESQSMLCGLCGIGYPIQSATGLYCTNPDCPNSDTTPPSGSVQDTEAEKKVLTSEIEDGQLKITIGFNTLAFATENNDYLSHDDFQPRYRVTNPLGFAEDVLNELEREDEVGNSLITKMIDKGCVEAIEQGTVHVDEVPPTTKDTTEEE